jgi:NAD(P)-dependent dehydrogenase (short-subunit alcohol dehydrogenase family)
MPTNHRWTASDIPDQAGRIALVTGANSGLGYETARALTRSGATVILACRNLNRGKAAMERIDREEPRGTAHLMQLDLADLASVRRFAAAFQAGYDRLDLLILNAGVMMVPERQKTADGFEMHFGTNHLGHFALTGLTLDPLLDTPGARVVTVASAAHLWGKIDFDHLQAEGSYHSARAYGSSKLANLLFAYELQRRFEAAGTSTLSVAAHPGWAATNLQRHLPFVQWLNPRLATSPERGALPTLYAATAPGVQGGDYFGPGGLGQLLGAPARVRSSHQSHDPALAARLWAVSEEFTGVAFLGPISTGRLS